MQRLLQSYPRIYLACHTRHLRDDETGRSLSPRLGSILDHLDVQPPLTLSTLAKHLDVTESTVSLQMDKLETLGYVKRTRDTQDRRRVMVRLTSAGKRVKEQNSVLDAELVRGDDLAAASWRSGGCAPGVLTCLQKLRRG